MIAADAYVLDRFPDKPVFLIGVSLGAAVSLQALPHLPHVRGVWSEGSFARFSDVAANQFRWLPAILRGGLMAAYYRLGWVESGFWGPSTNPVECLKGVSVPVHFCHGEKDELVPLAQGQSLFEAYGGPKWNWWVPGASHYNVRQKNREEYLRRLRGFLSGCLAAEVAGLPTIAPYGFKEMRIIIEEK